MVRGGHGIGRGRLIWKGIHMRKNEAPDGIWDAIWGFFASVRLTIMLLLSLAATSIIGTFVPQNKQPMEYLQAFGEFGYRLLSALDFFDMYRSWWFRLLIILLVLNIIICSVERLASIGKILFVKTPRFKASRFRKAKSRQTFDDERNTDSLQQLILPVLKRKFSYTRTETVDDRVYLYAEKWRWTRVGVYIVHLSIVVLLLGSLIGSMFGFEGFVNIPENETVDSIFLRQNGQPYQLPFAIRCDDFAVSFYDNGAPKEFRSSLTILEDGQTRLQKDIIVNDPLRYRGINLFQSSYGKMPPEEGHNHVDPPEEVELRITSKSTGKSFTFKSGVGQGFELPDGLGQVKIAGFQESMAFGGQDLGPGLVVELVASAGEKEQILLPLHFPNFDKMRGGDLFFTILGQKQRAFKPEEQAERYYTGLQVTKDPGVPVVYTGFIGMILGFIVTFFMSHQTVCVELTSGQGRTHVAVAGIADRNKLGMERKTERLVERLKSL
jgi:cytochrome c biogenesis protein